MSPNDGATLTASLTLTRPMSSGIEVFWARRTPDRSFLGGFHAFFAGSVESSDAELPIDTPQAEDCRFRAAALRECLEECGALFSTGGLRRLQASRRRDLEHLISPLHPLAGSRLEPLGWWRTPTWMTPGFLTAFYALRLTEEEGRQLDDLSTYLDSDEFDSGEWIRPTEALKRWRRAEALTTTPIRLILEDLAESSEISSQLGASQTNPGSAEAIEICGGLVLIPLKTPTLPPATHTTAFVVGRCDFIVVDPGPHDEASLQPLTEYLRRRLESGHRCRGVFLTHHHRDHIGGVEAVAELVDAPIMAHPETLKLLGETAHRTRPISDEEEIAVDHPGPWTALHTPGHAPGHLALYQADANLLIAGDLVASQGTIIVDPPQGNMGDYLRSLRRVRKLEVDLLLPAHGPPVGEADKLIDHYLHHRQMREDKVLAALEAHSPSTSSELIPHVYDDAPKAVWPLAERSLLAHLHHLVEQGLAEEDEGVFAACR